MKMLAVAVVSVMLSFGASGCAPAKVLSAMSKAAQTVQWLGSVLDYAEQGQRLFFDRHPNMEAEAEAKQKLQIARAALALANRTVAVAKAASDGDVVKTREEALEAYADYRALLDKLGVLSGTPPQGGAETDAPSPKPLNLPTVAEIAAAI